MDANGNKEVATLAGGCFWCLEPAFDQLRGVESVESGYIGGQVPEPTYRQVCDGDTGHAEAVQITYNTQEVSFRELLEVFFVLHDPTTLNRQGGDIGTQYRSAIFYHTPEQQQTAEEIIRELDAEKIWNAPIVTEVSAAPEFYVAEDYHQEYFAQNANQPYCRAVVAPKVAKFRQKFFAKLKR